MAMTEEEKRAYNRAYYKRNREKRIAAVKKWSKENPDKVRAARARFKKLNPEYQRQWTSENKDKVKKYNARPENVERRRLFSSTYAEKYPCRVKSQQKSWRDKLCDGYIKGIFCRYSNLTFKDIPQSLIQAKRAELKLKRLIKEQ